MEITFSEGCDLNDLFPIVVALEQEKTFFEFKVVKVVDEKTGKELKFDFTR